MKLRITCWLCLFLSLAGVTQAKAQKKSSPALEPTPLEQRTHHGKAPARDAT